MATHSSFPAWRIPWTEEPGGLQSMGSQRHDWVANTRTRLMFISTFCLYKYVCSWLGNRPIPWCLDGYENSKKKNRWMKKFHFYFYYNNFFLFIVSIICIILYKPKWDNLNFWYLFNNIIFVSKISFCRLGILFLAI